MDVYEQVVNNTITLIMHIQSIYANLHAIADPFWMRTIESIFAIIEYQQEHFVLIP